jgi:hypothetical protein
MRAFAAISSTRFSFFLSALLFFIAGCAPMTFSSMSSAIETTIATPKRSQ